MKKPRLFLCHHPDDFCKMHELHNQLEREDWIQLWFNAEENLLPGQNREQEIAKEVETTDLFLICLSRRLIIEESHQQKQIKMALQRLERKPKGALFIVLIKLEECKIPRELDPFHCVKYFGKNQEQDYQRILKVVKLKLEKMVKQDGVETAENPALLTSPKDFTGSPTVITLPVSKSKRPRFFFYFAFSAVFVVCLLVVALVISSISTSAYSPNIKSTNTPTLVSTNAVPLLSVANTPNIGPYLSTALASATNVPQVNIADFVPLSFGDKCNSPPLFNNMKTYCSLIRDEGKFEKVVLTMNLNRMRPSLSTATHQEFISSGTWITLINGAFIYAGIYNGYIPKDGSKFSLYKQIFNYHNLICPLGDCGSPYALVWAEHNPTGVDNFFAVDIPGHLVPSGKPLEIIVQHLLDKWKIEFRIAGEFVGGGESNVTGNTAFVDFGGTYYGDSTNPDYSCADEFDMIREFYDVNGNRVPWTAFLKQPTTIDAGMLGNLNQKNEHWYWSKSTRCDNSKTP